MKKKVTKTVILCDSCHKEDYTQKCLGCGKDFCYECRQKKGVEYAHGVYFSGSYDGFYCHACDKSNAKFAIHQAYAAIRDLRTEADQWQKDFNRRKDDAENLVKKLLKEAKDAHR